MMNNGCYKCNPFHMNAKSDPLIDMIYELYKAVLRKQEWRIEELQTQIFRRALNKEI